ncbi:MAG: hypothetical protein FGM24_04640 [Candidatus Kapabacteria bacterium]|nr:hypothetical protein [Candidatus Kapabacteria bacterium]
MLIMLSMSSTLLFARVQREAVPTTTDVMSELISMWASERAVTGTSLTLDIASHPEKTWFEASMIAALQARGVSVERATDGARHRVVILDASTRYEPAESADSVLRIVTLRLFEETINADGKRVAVMPIDTIKTRRVDVMSRDNVASTQTDQHPSMRGDVPPPPRDIWDDVLEPVVYVAAAAVTVVLLFTVRSR